MSVFGKLETEVEAKAPAYKFHEVYNFDKYESLIPWQLSSEQVHNYNFQQKKKGLRLWPVKQREWQKSALEFFSPS